MLPSLFAVLAQPSTSACADAETAALCGFFATFLPDGIAGIASNVTTTASQILLILVVAYIANRLVRRAIRGFVRDVKEQGLAKLGALRSKGPLASTGPIDLARATMRTETVGGVLRSIATVVISTIAFVTILSQLGLQIGPLIAGAGIVGVALGFGAQSLVKDVLAGISILLEDQYGVGDIVDLGEGTTPVTGTVESVSLRITRLRDVYGTLWIIPNGEIRAVGNKSQQWARSIIDIGISYETDIEHAKRVMKRVADELGNDLDWSSRIIDEPEVWGVESFGSNEIVIRMVVRTEPARQFEVERELRARIKQAFDQEGIEIPFPQRTVRVRAEDDTSEPATPSTRPRRA